MGEEAMLQPTHDVVLVPDGDKWMLDTNEPVEKSPGTVFVIAAPKALADSDWDVWFDPMKGPHTPQNQSVVIQIPANVAHATQADLDAGEEKTVYKYTVRIKQNGAQHQVIDPKIIISPPR